jgi:precorrin isomerase
VSGVRAFADFDRVDAGLKQELAKIVSNTVGALQNLRRVIAKQAKGVSRSLSKAASDSLLIVNVRGNAQTAFNVNTCDPIGEGDSPDALTASTLVVVGNTAEAREQA